MRAPSGKKEAQRYVHSLEASGSDHQLSARLDHPPNFVDGARAGTNVVENHRDEDNIKRLVRKRHRPGCALDQHRAVKRPVPHPRSRMLRSGVAGRYLAISSSHWLIISVGRFLPRS